MRSKCAAQYLKPDRSRSNCRARRWHQKKWASGAVRRFRAVSGVWCRRRDLNPRPPAYEADALPLSYAGMGRNRRNCARLNGRALSLASKPASRRERPFEQAQVPRAARRLGFRVEIGRRIGAGIVGHVQQRNHRLDPRRELRRLRRRARQRGRRTRLPGAGSAGGRGAGGSAARSAAARRSPAASSRRVRRYRSTSRASPSSASGTFHWNASSRPLTGDTGIQRSDTKPSAVQADRAPRAARAPSIRGRGLRRRFRAARSRPSARRRAGSAPSTAA